MRTSLLISAPLLALAACVVHTGPSAGNNPAPATTPAPTAAATTPPAATTAAAAPTATASAAPTTAPTGATSAAAAGLGPSGGATNLPKLRAPAVAKPIIWGVPKPTDKTILGEVFEIPNTTKELPDFGTLQPIASVYTSTWDVAPRKFDEGFPGVKDRVEWFAIRWAGKVKATKAGTYAFKLKSDDGARMYIDGQMIINNDGQHPPKEATGQTVLNAGEHDFELRYFQGPKFEVALQLWVTPPGGAPKIFTTTF